MEKLRRIFPVLFVLVLLLFIPAAQAETTTISYFESLSWEITYESTTAEIISLAAKNNDTGETFSGSQISFIQRDCTPATCLDDGHISFYATVQGVTYYNISVSLDSLDHIWSDWIIDPDTGNHYKKCLRENCSGRDEEHEPKYNYKPPLGGPELSRTKHSKRCSICCIEMTEDHQFEYTPNNEVIHKKTCQLCNFSEQDVHNFSEWVPVDGQNKHTQICSDCRMAVTEDHHFKPLDVGDGNHIWKCNVCGAVQPGAEKEPHQYATHKNVGNGCHNWACACGAVNPDTSAVPHEYSWNPSQAADRHSGTCSICGWHIYEGHDFSLIRNDETGHWKECICGSKETEPQPHEWICKIGEDDLKGSHYQVCSFCEYADDPVPHQYELTYVDEEYHIWICTCGAVKPETDKEPHDYVLTDVGEGYHMWKCACGAVKPETDAELHDYELTYVDEEYHMWKCVCGAVKPETEAQEHEYGNWIRIEGTNTHKGVCDCGAEDIADCSGGTPTCTAGAICDICGLEYGEPDPANHDLAHHDAKPATCTEIGWDAYDTCKREGCGYTTYKEIAALGHDLEHRDAQAATCTDFGWEAYDRCTREGCDYSTYKEIPALGHDIEHHDAKAATCTEDGWPAYDTCKREGCNYTTLLIMQAKLGHDLVHHEAKAATCTEAGWEAYDTCKREGCDYSTYQEIPALGHDLVKHDAKAATCTEAGWDAYDTCSRCSYTTYSGIPASGHIPGEPVETARQEPQVGKAGYEETRICCTVCGLELEYSYHELPALPEPVPDKKEETTGKPDTEIAIAPKRTVLRIIQPEFLEEEQGLELSVNQQIVSDDGGVDFQTGSPSFYLDIPPRALKLIEAKVWRLERFSDLSDRVILDYTGSQEFPLNLDLVMILVYRGDDDQEHWEVLKKPTRLFGNRLRAVVDAALVRELEYRPFAIIILADDGTR